MELVWAVLLALAAGSGYEIRVARQALTGTAATEQLEERTEIRERRDEALDASDGDVNLWEATRQGARFPRS